ncbi:hypothetical protein Tco_1400114 [Tanacetum coccineum]
MVFCARILRPHNLLLDRNTLTVPPVVGGQLAIEDSEAIMKSGTDWGKASFECIEDGQILSFCSTGEVVVGIQVMKTAGKIGLRYMKECLTQKLILLGAQLLILTLSSATSSSACLDFSSASAVKPNILHSSTKVLGVKTMNLGGVRIEQTL